MANRSINSETPGSVADWVRWVEAKLDEAGLYFGHGTDNALDEAAWLVGGALGIAPAELDARLPHAPTPAEVTAIQALVQQRIDTRKPTAYLLKQAWFAGLPFYVDERVIVPRSLTAEFIMEQFQPWVTPARVKRVLDLCTGSGCMAIALAYAFPNARVDAVDISADAVAVATINVERHGLAERVRVLQSDLYSALTGERYDLLVTNPPYVGREEMRGLPAEYRHEPELALASGDDGLDAIIRILAQAPSFLTADGALVAEVGNSHDALQRAFPTVPFVWLTTQAGDESVFLLTTQTLVQYHTDFVRR